jgi:hypothetical protein
MEAARNLGAPFRFDKPATGTGIPGFPVLVRQMNKARAGSPGFDQTF